MTMTKAGYILLFLSLVAMILVGVNAVLKRLLVEKTARVRITTIVGIAIAIWTAYIFALSASGFLQSFTLPPRFPIFIIFPLFLFTGIFLFRYRNSEFIKTLPKSWAVYFQSFRIAVELLFAASVADGVLHREVSLHGYNFDIAIGLTAPIIAYLAFNRKIISEKIVLIWNFVGLAVLTSVVALFFTTVFFPTVWGVSETWANPEFATFPYTLVAGFLMPVAVFMHILSIVQLTRKSA